MLLRSLLLTTILSALSLPVYAERLVLTLHLKDDGFSPKTLTIPANKAIKIQLINDTNKVAELESYDMKFEKIVVPSGHISVFTGPLKAGEYTFFNDYADQVNGSVIVNSQ